MILRLKFLHVTQYQKDVSTDRGILKVGSDLPGYILSKEAPYNCYKKELQIRRLKLQKGCNERSFIFATQSKIKLKIYIS